MLIHCHNPKMHAVVGDPMTFSAEVIYNVMCAKIVEYLSMSKCYPQFTGIKNICCCDGQHIVWSINHDPSAILLFPMLCMQHHPLVTFSWLHGCNSDKWSELDKSTFSSWVLTMTLHLGIRVDTMSLARSLKRLVLLISTCKNVFHLGSITGFIAIQKYSS
jgi:hypothetical protein